MLAPDARGSARGAGGDDLQCAGQRALLSSRVGEIGDLKNAGMTHGNAGMVPVDER